MVKAYRDVAYAKHQRKIGCTIRYAIYQQNMHTYNLKQSFLGQCSKRLERSNSVMLQAII